MYVFHSNQIWDSIKDQSNCGLYIWIVFMNICFGFKVRPFLFCYRFDLKNWSRGLAEMHWLLELFVSRVCRKKLVLACRKVSVLY